MEKFHAERHGNKVEVNREPETEEELNLLSELIREAMVYALISEDNPYIVYPKE